MKVAVNRRAESAAVPRELDRRRGHLSGNSVLVDDGHLGRDDVRLHHHEAAAVDAAATTVHVAVHRRRLGEVGDA